MTMDCEVSSVYKEKKWGNEEGGEYITDGYAFRGKKSFEKALTGLKETMERGIEKDINGVHFKVLDTRKKGVELEIEIEMNEKMIKE